MDFFARTIKKACQLPDVLRAKQRDEMRERNKIGEGERGGAIQRDMHSLAASL